MFNLVISFLEFPYTSFAYIGPGMGTGAIVAIFGFFAACFLGLWGILYYPIKRLIKNKKITKKKQLESKNNLK